MLRVIDLYKTLPNGKELLSGISFDVGQRELVSILGPSGAGKSLTLRCINGLMKPTRGEVWITTGNNESVLVSGASGKKLRSIRKHIGVVFQGFHLVGRLTALENVMIGRLGSIGTFRSVVIGFTDQEAEEAMDALEQVKIRDLAFRRVSSLSGGEMQRVAIARAIHQRPQIILADEPIANLDPGNAINIMQLLRTLAEEIPIVGVFHQPEIAAKFSTRTVAIKSGKVIYNGDPKLNRQQLEEIYGEELRKLSPLQP